MSAERLQQQRRFQRAIAIGGHGRQEDGRVVARGRGGKPAGDFRHTTEVVELHRRRQQLFRGGSVFQFVRRVTVRGQGHQQPQRLFAGSATIATLLLEIPFEEAVFRSVQHKLQELHGRMVLLLRDRLLRFGQCLNNVPIGIDDQLRAEPGPDGILRPHRPAAGQHADHAQRQSDRAE